MAKRGPRGGGVAKRERILRAAIRIFSQKGYFNSKISEIARQAGVADGTIYLYFKNKDDLLISLFEEKMGEVVTDIRARVADGSGALHRLQIFIRNHMDLLTREAGLIEVIQVELRQSNKFMKEYVPVKFLEYLDVISGILEDGKREGVIRPDLNVTLARRAIFGALDEISLAYVLSRKRKYDPASAAAEIYRIVAEGLTVSAPKRGGGE
ncbi:MAG TPA: TetR/AcrR family transcriptional regulator [Candidatus Limnocylindrales bacterium]|nr:TetR/AcrR family transcriptional regulator [Candidatus Limnocylindrales bacterium]